MDSQTLQAWLDAKEAERQAQETRRQIEDQLASELQISEADESARTIEAEGYKVKVTPRINRTVNTERLQELAVENGLQDHIERLFRWKAELSLSAWRKSDPSITAPLADAITTKPGRPSFSIEPKETE